MLRQVAMALQFLVTHPRSCLYAVLTARREVQQRPLAALADRKQSDKGLRKHLYTRIYDDLLRPRRHEIDALLEIGLLCHQDQRRIGGGRFSTVPSLEMWAEFLPRARVYGFDIQDFTAARGAWTALFRGDQANREDLRQITATEAAFDVIIDDALHASWHQQVSFAELFAAVKPGGLYIFEDLHYQPPEYEHADVETTGVLLAELKASGRWLSTAASAEECALIERETAAIEFHDSMSHGLAGSAAVCVVHRRPQEGRE